MDIEGFVRARIDDYDYDDLAEILAVRIREYKNINEENSLEMAKAVIDEVSTTLKINESDDEFLKEITTVPGTCFISPHADGYKEIPSYEDCVADKKAYAIMDKYGDFIQEDEKVNVYTRFIDKNYLDDLSDESIWTNNSEYSRLLQKILKDKNIIQERTIIKEKDK